MTIRKTIRSTIRRPYFDLVRPGSGLNQIDYSGIIASLNLLTDTSDTAYDGTDPTLAGMETALDTINGEIITP